MIIFQLHLFQFRVRLTRIYLSSSGHKVGHPWTERSSITGHTPTHTPIYPHTHTGTMEIQKLTSQAHLWDVRGNWNIWRNPTQTGWKCANSTHTQGLWLGIDFSPSLTLWQNMLNKMVLFEDLVYIHLRGANDQRKGTKAILMFK